MRLSSGAAADGREFRVVMMRRPVAEVVASQRAMLARQGKASAAVPDAQLEKLFADQLARLNTFLGGELDEAAMARAVDPALYREKR